MVSIPVASRFAAVRMVARGFGLCPYGEHVVPHEVAYLLWSGPSGVGAPGEVGLLSYS